ncbi:MAG: SDR family NAD(P)-dependent oxidoreductase [Xanthomonadales bacterium]|nr:SDR family NAD(P)-dependent oxidoreductase [Xanthomonadales bacterium]
MTSPSRRVLITGAGSGLGLALARRYARSGARVACVDLTVERAEAGRASLTGDGHLALAADVGDDASMQALHDAVAAAWGGVDVLVNNAGIASAGALVDTTMDEWRRILEIDLLGVVRGCRLFLPQMLADRRGQVVNTASFAGLAGAPGIMSYGVAKAGVVALSEQLRAELHGSGVSVSVFCPAFFRTNLMDTAIADEATRAKVQRWMDRSPDTLDGVADKAFAACERGDFLILPTRREPGRWRLKRWFPGLYFRMLLKLAKRRAR